MRRKNIISTFFLYHFPSFLQNVVQNTPEEPLVDVSHTSPRPTSPALSDVPETPPVPVSSNHHQSDAIHSTPVHNNAPNGVPSSSRRMPSDSTSLPSMPEALNPCLQHRKILPDPITFSWRDQFRILSILLSRIT